MELKQKTNKSNLKIIKISGILAIVLICFYIAFLLLSTGKRASILINSQKIEEVNKTSLKVKSITERDLRNAITTPEGVTYTIFEKNDVKNRFVYIRKTIGENISWEISVPFRWYFYDVSNILLMPDGGVVFTAEATGEWSSVLIRQEFRGLIVKCNADGYVEWKKEITNAKYGIFKKVFATKDSGLLLVGNVASNDKVVDPSNSDEAQKNITIIKLNSKGEEVGFKSYGGTKEEDFVDASYSEESGLAVLFDTFSNEGQLSVLACFDSSLNLKWKKSLNGTFDGAIASDKKNIYFLNRTKSSVKLEVINEKGNIIKSKTNFLDSTKVIKGIKIFDDLLVGYGYQSNAVRGQNSFVVFFNKDLKIKKKIISTKSIVSNVLKTKTGFFIESFQFRKQIKYDKKEDKKYYDKAIIIEKFSNSYKLEARKVINDKIDTFIAEQAYPQINDTIIIP